jgi:predicted lactoylglutathione lyase
MVALKVASLDDIKRLHALALTLGATDEGTPGPRLDGKFYCGYFRDLDHNKFNLFTVA